MTAPHRIVIVGGAAGGPGLPPRAGTPCGARGEEEHVYGLECACEGDRFHRRLINACIQANYRPGNAPAQLRVVIVGAGATGVELAAELHNTTRVFAAYGLQNIDPERFLHITLVNADPRILPMLPERIATAVTGALEDLGVRVACSEEAVEVTASEVKTKSGKSYPAQLAVWAAGIKGADFLKDLDGLETNRINQLVVRPTLQTTHD